jgi:DNA gyrase subunit A
MVTAATPPEDRVIPIRIEEEMRTSYLTYAMSVIVARALPDVRDGLKPVQRRILYAMHEMGIRPGSQHRKCARIAGEVLGKFHPHGESSVYDTLVRMAQPFSMRYPLIDGQGNFGSVDGDPPAAMRYTESRLARIADELLADIDQNTVDFLANFDDSIEEPSVLPSRLPNMLVNGTTGIAVGMATNIPPHNLGEICDAICYLVDNPNCTAEDLIKLVPGPDFPTSGIIRGTSGIVDTYNTGRGRIVMEAATEIEEVRGGRQRIIVSELPYQVNKATLVEKIAQLTRDKKVEGISDIRDESDRHGMRVVIELRRDAQPNIVLNNLYKHTTLRTAFNSIVLALVDGQPQVLPLKRSLALFIEHRDAVIRRRSEFRLQRARDRDHIVQGLLLALDRMDEVIATIRASADVEEARTNLMQNFDLSQPQSQAILDMQLRRLAALERERLEKEHQDLLDTIAELEALLADPGKIMEAIKEETVKLKADFGDARKTVIYPDEIEEQSAEEFITHQDVIITLSQRGYIKRVPRETYRTQHRGGKGVRGMSIREDDDLMQLAMADTHDTLLLFTNRGRVYPLRVFNIASDTSRTSRGTLLVNLVPLARGEQVQTMLRTQNAREEDLLILATKQGQVKSLKEKELANIRPKGLNVMNLRDDDELVSVCPRGDGDDVVMVSEQGMSIRFPVDDLRTRTRAAGGVRGITLREGDQVVGMAVVSGSPPETDDAGNGVPQTEAAKGNEQLLVVSRRGFGKCSDLGLYRTQGRGGQGIITFKVTKKTGPVAGIIKVVPDDEDEELFIISAKAQIVRIGLDGVRRAGRATQGVILWRDRVEDDYVASVSLCPRDLIPEEDEPGPAPSRNGTKPNGASGK